MLSTLNHTPRVPFRTFLTKYFTQNKPSLAKLATSVLLGCALGACHFPYRHDVVQGNFVSQERVNVLKEGMTRSQVLDTLGTPLLVSVFHEDRWDFVFTLNRQGKQVQNRKLALFFKGDNLVRIESEKMPTEQEFVASIGKDRSFLEFKSNPKLEMTAAELQQAVKEEKEKEAAKKP